MPQPKHDPILVTCQKLNELQNTYDQLRNEQNQPTHARELTLRSLNDLINQLKEDLIRMESNSSDESITFRTLKGFLTGNEPDEPDYFCFCATLRIHGDDVPFDEISRRLGVQPTNTHRKGERRRPQSKPFSDDAWHYQPSLAEIEPLERHIDALWQVVQPEVDYLKSLKQRFKIDVFCGYRSNCDHAGFVVSHKCLELFTALEIPFGVSVIVV